MQTNFTEKEYIKQHVEAIKESIHFFSNECQKDREIWVTRNFLSLLNVEYSENEVQPSLEEPSDVIFRDARFQVKEILDKDRKRGDEYKEELLKAEKATVLSDLLESYSPQMITCDDVAALVVNRASKLNRKYGPFERAAIDLLFYFNLQDVHVKGDIICDVDFYSSKISTWRSVSVYTGDCAFVLHVSEKAPDFLKAAKVTVFRKLSE